MNNFDKIILTNLILFCLAIAGCRHKTGMDKSAITRSGILSKDNFKEQKETNITIFVHGTHTQPLTKLFKKYIYGPKEGICKLTELHPRCYMRYAMEVLTIANSNQFPGDHFYTFSWSGKLSSKARYEDSKLLYNQIKSLINEYSAQGKIPKITIITHSHGGNVTLNLAQNQNNNIPEFIIDKLILLACPVQCETKHLIKHKMFKKIYNIYSTVDMLQVMDPQGIKTRNKNKNYPIFSERHFDHIENLKQSAIKINNHSLWHIEFIMDKFLLILPELLKTMDTLECSNNAKYIIKINTKKKSFDINNTKK